MDKYYLYPGSIFVNKKPHIVDTILGSCIAVTLWDCVLQFGGINHYMLPTGNDEGLAANRYGEIAIQELIRKMIALGSCKNNLRAKIFGGSETGIPNGVFQIGERNAKLAFEILKKEQIPIISHSVGGSKGRKVVFYSQTGEVMVKLIQPDTSAPSKNRVYKS